LIESKIGNMGVPQKIVTRRLTPKKQQISPGNRNPKQARPVANLL
jgi:hypothetical protein